MSYYTRLIQLFITLILYIKIIKIFMLFNNSTIISTVFSLLTQAALKKRL